jgi:amidase
MQHNSVLSLCGIIFLFLFSGGCTRLPQQAAGTTTFDVQETTIADIHRAFQQKTCTCEQLVSTYLRRIETYDQPTGLNAIILSNPEALQKARELDAEYQKTGKLRKLHCIPVIVKDNYNTKGLQTTAGSLAMKGFEPLTDAYQIQVLKEAGAIVLAKSNMAEWAFSPRVTISSIAGETRNPYNLNHVPAGSSGGTAAAVAANLGAVGLGTDTGNSIRGPSSHNALVGFRTTMGLISRAGIAPLFLRSDVGGPMCRTVEDATRMLDVLAGYDSADSLTVHSKGKIPDSYLPNLDKNGLKGARIGILRTLSDKDPDPQVKALFEQAIEDLKRLGAEIVDPFEVAEFDTLRKGLSCSVFQHDINEYLSSLGPKVPVKNLEEIVASGKFSPYIESNLQTHLKSQAYIKAGATTCTDAYHDAGRIAFRNAIVDAMDTYRVDAIIYPSWNHPPAKIGDDAGYKGDNSQIVAPSTGMPAFTIPMGYTYGNLPAGLQFVGRMFDEPTLIKLTYAYEQGTLHRKPPVGFGH